MSRFKTSGWEIQVYQSDLDIYTLKLRMRECFAEPSNAPLPAIRGRFTNHHRFEVWPVRNAAPIKRPYGPLPSVYMVGELIPNGKRTAIVVQIVAYPAWVPLFGAVAAGIVGIIRFVESKSTSLLAFSLVLLFGIPPVLVRTMANQRERLKENFTDLFNLKQVKTFGKQPGTEHS